MVGIGGIFEYRFYLDSLLLRLCVDDVIWDTNVFGCDKFNQERGGAVVLRDSMHTVTPKSGHDQLL